MSKIARCPFLYESVCIERAVTDKILNMPSNTGGERFLSIATPLLALPSSFLRRASLHKIRRRFRHRLFRPSGIEYRI
jgi:hypothetical protein